MKVPYGGFTGAEAVSTISIFQAAGEQGTDLLRIHPNNAEAMLQKLNADDATLEEVQNALHAGKEVTITAEAVTIGSWSGYGYIIMDPDSGAAAYMISGGLNGGSGSGVVTLEALLGLALSAVTLSALITDIIGILAVAASLTVFGWVVFAIEIVFLISTVLYMITLCEDYQDYINGDAAAGEKLVNEVMIFAASTLACMCVRSLLMLMGKE